MRRALALLLLAGAAEADAVEDCRASYAAAEAVLSIVAMPDEAPDEIVAEGGVCVATDVTSEPARDEAPELLYRRVTWSGDPAREFHVSVEAEPAGRRMPGNAVRRDSPQFEVSLARNETRSELAYSASFAGRNVLFVGLDAAGLDFGSPGRFRASLAGMTIYRADLNFESDGRLGGFLDGTLGPRDAMRPRDRERVGEWLGLLPDAVMPRRSRQAAARLMAAAPDPRGRGEIRLEASAGIRALALGALFAGKPSPEKLSGLSGLTLTVTYQP